MQEPITKLAFTALSTGLWVIFVWEDTTFCENCRSNATGLRWRACFIFGTFLFFIFYFFHIDMITRKEGLTIAGKCLNFKCVAMRCSQKCCLVRVQLAMISLLYLKVATRE